MINNFWIVLFSDTKLCQGHLTYLLSRLQVITQIRRIQGGLLILYIALW